MISYDVLYVDKFVDATRSQQVIESIAHLFHISPQTQQQLLSGQPVLVRENVDEQIAWRFLQAITLSGGTAWLQPQSNGLRERRAQVRRSGFDRRGATRSATAKADRRQQERRCDLIH